jgi:ABC-type transporter Mla subunit MlaD
MRTRIAICTCAVAMILVTAYSLSEAADRNKLGFGDPKAPLPKTPGIQKPAVSQTAQAIPLQEVPGRAESTRAELNTLLPAEASRQMLKRIASELDQALPEVTSRLAKTREALAGRPSVRTLQMLEAELREMREHLRQWDEELDKQFTGLSVVFKRLDIIAAVWDATAAEVSRQEDAATSTVARIATVLGEIDQARSAVVKWRNQILAVRDRILDPSSALANSLVHVQSATETRLRRIFQADQAAAMESAGARVAPQGVEGGRATAIFAISATERAICTRARAHARLPARAVCSPRPGSARAPQPRPSGG